MDKSVVSVDLLEAARRSETFPQDWSDEKRHRALNRYEKFLLLAASHPGMPIAPTRDIDEMWHLHMLSPRAYYRDCQRLFGGLLDHDGGFGKNPTEIPILSATFERTSELWQAAYGESYVEQTPEVQTRNCWHDCQGRCWHACSSGDDLGQDVPAASAVLPNQ